MSEPQSLRRVVKSRPVLFWAYAAASFVLLLVTRIPKEERMMLEAFGDEYRRYMQRTGRLLPRMTHHGGTEDTEQKESATDEHG